MAERYTKLYTTKNNLYKEGAPVILKAGALLLDTLNAKALAQLKFQSITPKKIVALSVALQAQNTAGAHLGDAILHTYLDLSVERDTEFGTQTPIYLPDAESRAFSVYVTKVEFADHTLWETDEAGWEALVIPSRPTYELLQSPAAVEEYHRRFGANADLLPETAKDLWRCSCGAINHREEERCHLCASKLEEMRAVTATDLEREHFYLLAMSLVERGDDDSLKQAIEHFTSLEDYKDSAERKAACEELLAQHQAGRKKAKKIGIIAASITAGILTCLAILFIGILPGVQIDQATALVEAGKDAEALLYLNGNCGLAEEFQPERYHAIKNGIFSRATEEAKALVEEGKYAEAYALMTERQCTWGDTYWLVEALNDKDYKKAVNKYGMTHIIVPNSVTSISAAMFYGCEALTSITIPNSVTAIDKDAFRGFSLLTSVMFEPGSQLTSIGDSAFYDCALLTSITIPSSVTSIGNSAFANCSSLSSITIPDSVTSIGNSAFANCSSLSSITIPDSVTSIGNSAFSGCEALTSITIPNSVTSIGESAFSRCSSLESIALPFVGGSASATTPSVSTLFGYIFGYDRYGGIATKQYYGSFYTTYYIPASLKSVTITGGNILYGAFQNCTSLQSITISNSVTSIGENAFSGCTSLTGVHITDLAAWCNIAFGNYDANPLRYAKNLYLNDTLVADLVIPKSVTSIGEYTFSGCSGLTSVEIPASVISISDAAFRGCTRLTSITIPASVTSIGTYAFAGDYDAPMALKSVTFAEGSQLTSIGDYAFDNCKSLASVTFEESSQLTNIGKGAFYWCTSLTSITIPNSVTSIGNSAFANCSSLSSITIPDSVTSIGERAFYNCTALTVINFNATAMPNLSEDNYVFANAGKNGRGITVNIGANVTQIPAYLFCPYDSYSGSDYSPRIVALNFAEDSVCKSIGNYAFQDCSSLWSITIPNSMAHIGNYAFYRCGSVSIYYGGTISSWDSISIFLGNTVLCNSATRYYYSETEPPIDGNNYWHYVNGIPTKW
ncbi:MAG: hypothetical protein E7624_04475 [Ruminococcaceae bacterium]|nr:hypothetical protein [Oscillospiraceae bacterium]